MAITPVQSANAGTTSANSVTRAATFSSAVTVGNSIAVVTSSRFNINTVADNKGNTYTRDTLNGASGTQLTIWRSSSVATGGSSFTVTATQAGLGAIIITIIELDKVLGLAGGKVGSGTSTAPALTNFMMPANSYSVIAFSAQPPGPPITSSPSGWVSRVKRTDALMLAEAMDRSFSALSLESPTWTISASRVWVALGAVYIEALQANFTGTPTLGVSPFTVAFTDASTGNPTTWAWTFGDGGTASTQNPSHEYTAAGLYTVSLTVGNGSNTSTFTRTNYIQVDAGGAVGGAPAEPRTWNSVTFGPPIPGAPWNTLQPYPPQWTPAGPEAAEEVEAKLLLAPLAKAGQDARMERESRIVGGLILNSLIRAKLVYRTGNDTYAVRTAGFASERDPDEDDDASIGARVGVIWVNQTDETAWYCADSTVGAAVWKQIDLAENDGVSGGLTGTFPD